MDSDERIENATKLLKDKISNQSQRISKMGFKSVLNSYTNTGTCVDTRDKYFEYK